MVSLGCRRSWYIQTRHASRLSAKYRKKLSDLDEKFHGTQKNETGPLVHRLLNYGELQKLVVGPWADCSKDLHELIKLLGKQRVKAQARARGRPAPDREQGIVVSQIRRVLSTTFDRAHKTCLLSRTWGYFCWGEAIFHDEGRVHVGARGTP